MLFYKYVKNYVTIMEVNNSFFSPSLITLLLYKTHFMLTIVFKYAYSY